MPHSKIIKFIVVVGLLISTTTKANALTLSPARIEITANPGDIYVGELSLINEQEESKTFYTSFQNFESSGDTGAPNFIDTREGLSTWLSAESQIVMGPKEEKTIEYTITVPMDARPGGHFAAIFMGTSPVEQTGSNDIAVGARVGALVLLRVNGDIKEGGGLDSLDTESGEFIFSHLPINLVYEFSNSGDDKLSPVGTLEVRNIFGLKVNSQDANPNKGNVLPQSSRKFHSVWGQGLTDPSFFGIVKYQLKHPAIGPYKAIVKLEYGTTNTKTEISKTLILIPWQILIILITVLVLVWLTLRRAVKQKVRMLQKQKELEDKIKELENQSKKNRISSL